MKLIFVIKHENGSYWVQGMTFNQNIFNATQFDKYELAENVIRELYSKDFKNVDIPLFFQIDKFFTNK